MFRILASFLMLAIVVCGLMAMVAIVMDPTIMTNAAHIWQHIINVLNPILTASL